jgi:hypothetical protein
MFKDLKLKLKQVKQLVKEGATAKEAFELVFKK